MKVTLIRHHDTGNINTRAPHSLHDEMGIMPPLGIGYIAAVLEKAGHEVSFIDSQASNLTIEEFRARLTELKPDIAGITSMTPTFLGALEAAKIAKEAGAIVVIGGPHLAVLPRESLSYPFIDYGIIGEGEYSMLDLVDRIKRGASVNKVEGLAYKENGKIKINQPSLVDDLQELPFPARHLLPMDRYSSILAYHPLDAMVTTRGCPYACGFCAKQPSDLKIRFRDAKNVVDEMGSLVKTRKVREIMFYDDTLTMRREHVLDICNEILNRGLKISWESPTRLDCLDPELLELMHEAGCRRLRVGVESGSQNILNLMQKNISLAQIRKGLGWIKESGIESSAYFIIGYLGETRKETIETISFMKELDPDLVMVCKAVPLPGTLLFSQAAEKGLVDKEYWSDFILGKRNDSLPSLAEGANSWLKYAFRSFYLRPAFLLKKLVKIRSWDQLKKHIRGVKAMLFYRLGYAR